MGKINLMKQLNNPVIIKESYEAQSKAGRYNPALVLVYDNHLITLGSGYDDTIKVFIEHDLIHVLSYNRSLNYVGLEIFNAVTDYELTSEVFFQTDSDIKEIFNTYNIDDVTANEMLDKLIPYCY